MSVFGDRRLIAKARTALVLANVRFWLMIVPLLATELKRWERAARGIENPALRDLALRKLADERFNSEVAATLATLAPREHREGVVQAIVAYEVMYDYLDGLTEQPSADPLRNGHELYQAFIDAIALRSAPRGDYFTSRLRQDDGGYLEELVAAARTALAKLPSAAAVAEVCERAAARCAEAQIRTHAVPRLGHAQLQRWAEREVADSAFGWQAFVAGAASSVLAVHALIAAAANPATTREEARAIDAVYLSIGVLSTMLDSLVDRECDARAGEPGFTRMYDSQDVLAEDLVRAARRAAECASTLRDGAHHLVTLVGVAAYYASAPSARGEFVRPVTQRLLSELRPLITPTLAVMRAWRLAKHARQAIGRRPAA